MFRTIVTLAVGAAALVASPARADSALQTTFRAAITQFAAYGEPGKTGIAIGPASAGGRTFPVARIKITEAQGMDFTLSRLILFVPDAQKDQTFRFRFTRATADTLVYSVTQTPGLTTASQTVNCVGRRNGQGALNLLFKCYRPAVEALGTLAEPSFTFTFATDVNPPFRIAIGEGLDNIFTLDASSAFAPKL
jgi:hypothetical protein